MDDKHKSQVGFSDCYVAEVTEDSATAYTAGTPAYLAPAAKGTFKPKTANDTQYADDMAADIAVSEAETEMEVELTNVDPETAALLTGKQFDSATGRFVDMAGTPPYFAFGFKSKKMNGHYRYYWYNKVMFSPSEEAFETQGEKKTPQPVKLLAKAIKTVFKYTVNGVTDGIKRIYGDDDTTNFDETGWFTQVQTPATTTPDALALASSNPAEDATGVSKTAAKTMTFNNALQDDSVDGVSLLDENTEVVAVTVSLDATKKIISVTPSSALTGTKAYTIVANVRDLYSQTLSTVVHFTTAA